MISENTTKQQIDVDAEHMAFFYELHHDADKATVITRGLQDVAFNLTLDEYIKYVRSRVIPNQITTSKAFQYYLQLNDEEKLLGYRNLMAYSFIQDTAIAIYKDASITSECGLLPSNICWQIVDQSEDMDQKQYAKCRELYVSISAKCITELKLVEANGYIEPKDTLAATSAAVYRACILLTSAFHGVHWNNRK